MSHFLTFFSLFLTGSSPIRSPVIENEIVLMNTMYKERFPKVSPIMYFPISTISPFIPRKTKEHPFVTKCTG